MFDKTGTLTRGKPAVTDFVYLDEQQDLESRNQLVWLAGCAESASEHPLARAVVEYATVTLDLRDEALGAEGSGGATDDAHAAPLHLPLDFKSVPGRGLRSVVSRAAPAEEGDDAGAKTEADISAAAAASGGREAEGEADGDATGANAGADAAPTEEDTPWEVLIGNAAWQRESNVELSARALELLSTISAKGRTAVVVSVDGVACAVVGMVDPVKPEAAVVVKALRAKGIEV